MSDRISKLQSYLLSSPGDSFLKHALALEYIKLGEDNQARELFEEILRNDPAYIGTYYHLGKLLERTGHHSGAINWYEKGLAASKTAGDNHAYNELRAALDELME